MKKAPYALVVVVPMLAGIAVQMELIVQQLQNIVKKRKIKLTPSGALSALQYNSFSPLRENIECQLSKGVSFLRSKYPSSKARLWTPTFSLHLRLFEFYSSCWIVSDALPTCYSCRVSLIIRH